MLSALHLAFNDEQTGGLETYQAIASRPYHLLIPSMSANAHHHLFQKKQTIKRGAIEEHLTAIL
jgi:hypothetical protein